MKTTVDLPDDLLVAAKKRAAELRIPLRALIEAGLRRELAALDASEPRHVDIDWIVAEGGVPKGLDLSSREDLGDWLCGRRRRE